MTCKNNFRRIRETEYFLKHIIEKNLKEISFNDEQKKTIGSYANYFHMWEATLSNKFYDMTTFVRLGTSIEGCLKGFYQNKSGFTNRKELVEHIDSRQNVFQQIQPWHDNGIIIRIKEQFKIDPCSIDELSVLQEIILLRHLYAHNSGLLDTKFVNDYKRLTGIDVCSSSSLWGENLSSDSNFKLAEKSMYSDYEYEDTYFFEPLEKLSFYISKSESFFKKLYAL